MSLNYYFIEKDGEPLAVDMKVWASHWQNNRQVGDDMVGDVRVSTVFLGINHRHSGVGPPILYETMIFGGEHDEDQWRYCTRKEAEAGHKAVVAFLKDGKKPSYREDD